jgi:hypothetical protein
MFITLALLCTAWSDALAQPTSCVDGTYSWTVPYSVGSVNFVTYYVDQLLLSVVSGTRLDLFVSVPLPVAQGFTGLTDATAYYNSRVNGHFNEALLAEDTGCPLLTEDTGKFLLAE